LEALRDLGADLFEGVALGGRDVPDLSGFDEVEVGVLTGELGEMGPLRSCREQSQKSIKELINFQMVSPRGLLASRSNRPL